MALKRSACEAALSLPSEEDRSDKTDTGKRPSREEDSASSPDPVQTPLTLVSPLPSLVVLDLDKTVWPVYCHEETTGPYTRHSDNAVGCSSIFGGKKIVRLYSDVMNILDCFKKQEGLKLAVASMSPVDEGGAARGILGALGLLDLFCFLEIHIGSKKSHFENIHAATGVPYREMLFFDDEHYNISTVSKLGVTCVKLSKETGLTFAAVNQGMKQYRETCLSRSSLKGFFAPVPQQSKTEGAGAGQANTSSDDSALEQSSPDTGSS